MDINVDLHTTVIYSTNFPAYLVLKESIHSVMLEPNNIEATAVEILTEWSFLIIFFTCFSTEF